MFQPFLVLSDAVRYIQTIWTENICLFVTIVVTIKGVILSIYVYHGFIRVDYAKKGYL